jgi:rhodanese-related sulfurtransferase
MVPIGTGAQIVFAWLMGLKSISPSELHRQMQADSPHVFDVNSRASWLQARVPGAKSLDPAGFAETDLPSDKRAALVFYCSNPMCRKAPTAARRAKQMGFANAFVMSAGITGWIAAKLPTESGI